MRRPGKYQVSSQARGSYQNTDWGQVHRQEIALAVAMTFLLNGKDGFRTTAWRSYETPDTSLCMLVCRYQRTIGRDERSSSLQFGVSLAFTAFCTTVRAGQWHSAGTAPSTYLLQGALMGSGTRLCSAA
jgi:hypothetical protein